MNIAIQKVYDKLITRGSKGVTGNDFNKLFRLAARIYDLRQLGYEIVMSKEYVTDTKWIARYTLIGRKDISENS